MIPGAVKPATLTLLASSLKTPQGRLMSHGIQSSEDAQEGKVPEALALYARMLQEGTRPTQFSISNALQVCARSSSLHNGKQLHCHLLRLGFEGEIFACTSLVDMYCMCQKLDYAGQVFNRIQEKNIVAWNAILTGFSKCSLVEDCFIMLKKLLETEIRPDHITFIVVLSSLSALEDSLKVFDIMEKRNNVTWNSMIIGYSQNGYGREAIDLFKDMITLGIKPASITFVGVLMACGHSGLVDDGRHYFELITKICGIELDNTHYTLFVDLLGRAGCLQEPVGIINRMRKPDAAAWGSLFGTC